MTVYYNEIEKHAAAWLRNLIDAGHIPAGVVDERSIEDVRPSDLDRFDQCHFFAGLGGWPLALRWAGWPDSRPVWSGSLPCQPFSAAGKGLAFADDRHLWPSFRHLIAQRHPPVLLGEQVASAAGREWFAVVRADLEALGYAAGAADLCAAGLGANHIRQRLYWTASDSKRDKQPREEPRSWQAGRVGRVKQPVPWNTPWECALAGFRAVGDGIPRCVEGTDAARNAVVPQVAQAFIEAVMEAA